MSRYQDNNYGQVRLFPCTRLASERAQSNKVARALSHSISMQQGQQQQQHYDAPTTYPSSYLYPPHQNHNDFASTDSLDRNYDAAPEEKYASNPGYPVAQKKRHVMRWVIGGIVVLLLGAGGGIAAWRITAAKNSSGTASGATSGPTNAAGFAYMKGSANAVMVKPGDMSQFQKDPRLTQSFYGLAYVPFHAQEPSCGAVQVRRFLDAVHRILLIRICYRRMSPKT